MTQLHLCSCTEGDPFGSPSGNTNYLPVHWRTSRVVRRCPMSRQSVPAGPLARTDDPRHSSRHYATLAPQTIVARSGFLLPRKPPPQQTGRAFDPTSRQARQRRVPQLRRFHTHNPSGAIESCYVVLPLLQYFSHAAHCLLRCCIPAVRLAAVLLTALLLCFLRLAAVLRCFLCLASSCCTSCFLPLVSYFLLLTAVLHY
jgi:hypothetical protein